MALVHPSASPAAQVEGVGNDPKPMEEKYSYPLILYFSPHFIPTPTCYFTFFLTFFVLELIRKDMNRAGYSTF